MLQPRRGDKSASPYFAWLSSLRGGAVTPSSLASWAVKPWLECLLSKDSMKHASEKSVLSVSVRGVLGTSPAARKWTM